MLRKVSYLLLLFLFTNSCADTFDSVKRGLTGAKGNTTDEFLVEKKAPLILPPDFENLPTPDDTIAEVEENPVFENILENSVEDNPSSSNPSDSVEGSILKRIQSK